MVAAFGKAADLGLKRALVTGGIEQGPGAFAGVCKGACFIIDPARDGKGDVVGEARQAGRRAFDAQARLGLFGIAADHVEVDGGERPNGELGPRVQQRDRAFDLARPEEADRTQRLRQFARGDQRLEGARDLKDSSAAAGIVVGTGVGMVEVAGIDDFVAPIAARNDCGWNAIFARLAPGDDLGAQMHRLAALHPRLPGVRLRRRDHEGEGRVQPGIEMAPAEQALIFAPPAGLLVLRPRHDPRGAIFGHRQRRRRIGLARNQDQLAADRLAGIVAVLVARADVNEGGVGRARDAIFRKAERLVGPGGDSAPVAPDPPPFFVPTAQRNRHPRPGARAGAIHVAMAGKDMVDTSASPASAA